MGDTPAPKASGVRVVTLGTQGGPVPRAHRAQSANLLVINGIHYLIDAGDGVSRRLAKAGVNLRDIGIIFLTHLHDDHMAGLGTLLSGAWDMNRTDPIRVYGPTRTALVVRAAIDYFTPNAEIRIADGGRSKPISEVFFGYDISEGVIYQDENVSVTAVENTHFAFHEEPKHKSFSYRFDSADRSIVFTGDTGPCEAVIELSQGADLLVCEVNSARDRMSQMMSDGRWEHMNRSERDGIVRQAERGHLTPEHVGRLAAKSHLAEVVLTHLTYRPNDESFDPWVAEIQQHYPGRVRVATDLSEY